MRTGVQRIFGKINAGYFDRSAESIGGQRVGAFSQTLGVPPEEWQNDLVDARIAETREHAPVVASARRDLDPLVRAAETRFGE